MAFKGYLIFSIIFLLLSYFKLGLSFEQNISHHENPKLTDFSYSFTNSEILKKRNEVKDLITFALDSYLDYGWPFDEVRPISCIPNQRNWDDPTDINKNDVLGNFTITLFDSLTTLAVIGDVDRFKSMVQLIDSIYKPHGYSFDSDVTIQIFETTIRIIGSLISAHLYASDPRKKVYLGSEYLNNPFLLTLARNMADKLLPVYLTETGLPYPRINLKSGIKGIPEEYLDENNIAGMASPMFEFTLLSYLTYDSKYELVTRYAYTKLWATRTNLDLLISSINPQDGLIRSMMTGIGASIDSFYEYALKGSILFDDPELYQIWQQSYNALKLYSRNDWFYSNVMVDTGFLANGWIDSLSAFWPGLLVLDGDIEDSVRKHLLFNKLWNVFGAIPERWAFNPTPDQVIKHEKKIPYKSYEEYVYGWKSIIPLEWYPLRPEFVESTYFLYKATKDPFYLNIGYQILDDLQNKFKANCGFAGIQNIETGEKQDRMETFVISETLKYLYLLFDESNEIHNSRDNVIFSTEAHPVWLTKKMKQLYNKNKYFNDTLYINHLRHCHEYDRQVKDIDTGKFEFLYLRFKSERYIESDTFYIQGTCKNIEKYWQNTKRSLPYSFILSRTPDLFEVETRYKISFPNSWNYSKSIELNPSFYYQWSDPIYSKSRRTPTTESFEILLSFDNNYTPPIINKNHYNKIFNFSFTSGIKKFRLEKIVPGQIDTYNNVLDTDFITKTDHFNVPDEKFCGKRRSGDNEKKSLSMVYRASVVDGLRLEENDIIVLNGTKIKSQINQQRSSFSSFFQRRKSEIDQFQLGYNRDNQLMLGCVPVVNVYLI